MKLSKRQMMRLLIGGLLLIFLLGGGKMLMMRKKASLAQSPKFQYQPRPVETVKSVQGNLEEGYRYLAVIEPFQMANVSSRVTAVVDKVFHWEGDSVKAGEVLATLDDRQVRDSMAVNQAQIKQAEAEKKALNVTLESLRQTQAYWLGEKERNEKLLAKGATSQSKASASAERYSDASGKLHNAEKKLLVIDQQIITLRRQLDQLKTTLQYYQIVSPFEGVLSDRACNPGDMASPGKVLFNVEDRSAIKLTFSIPQGDMNFVKVGSKAHFTYSGRTYQAEVSRVFPKLNRARMVTVEAVLSREERGQHGSCSAACKVLPLGAYVDFTVVYNQLKDVVLVPRESLIKRAGNTEVYVVEKGVLHRKKVTVLGADYKNVAVDGIGPGDEVVVSSFLGWAHLVEGMNVEKK